jgi:outer membrane protein OmpA-like peptidoglycan-associated protein
MQKLFIGAAVVATVLAAPAMARDGSAYIGVGAGGTVTKHDPNVFINGDPVDTDFNTDIGYDVEGVVGYDLGMFRIEAEGSYRRYGIDSFRDGSGALTGLQGTEFSVDGRFDALSLMLNGMIDIGKDDGLQAFVGGGAGISKARVKLADLNSPGSFRGKESDIAWQIIAGVRYPVTRNLDVGLKYRYYNAPVIGIATSNGGVDFETETHSALVTLTYNFGGAEPPPPPAPPPSAPPPPPPPPPPPQAVCNKGPYIVFFDWDKANITPEAATILDSAVTAYGNCDVVPIMLAGYTDRSGSTQYNLGLSARRNSSVRDYLTTRGIPNDRITSQAFGEANPRVPTADGVRELQNRRVEITYGPGSGM